MRRRIAFILSIAGVVVALASIGYGMLFSNFATYDDEGYILISARQYFAHGKLYEGVYSQYGPAFYCLMDFLQHLLGPVDHTFARWLTLVLWLGTAICCGGIVWRQTTSRALTFFTIPAVFLYLYFITDEPFHPGSLVFFLLAASLWIATELIAAGKCSQVAIVTGAVGAILLLTKINAGAFYVIAVAAWAAGHAASDPLRRLSAPLLAVIAGSFAFVLMLTLIREPWVQTYLVIFGCGLTGLLIATHRSDALIPGKFVGNFAAAGLLAGLAVLASIWLRGTSLSGIVDGVLLGPLRHPGNYSYPVDWRPGSLLVASVSLVIACGLPWLKRTCSPASIDLIMVLLRALIALGLAIGVAVLIQLRAVGAIFSFVAPLVWILILPLSSTPNGNRSRAAATLVAWVLLLQFLHAYPVGGAQESWGTFLFIPLVAIGLGDVRLWLLAHPASLPLKRWGWRVAGAALVTIALAKTGGTAWWVQRDFQARTALNLPGAMPIRLPPLSAAAYRILALNAVAHSDTLFSLPGMFSFNLWTELPTPTDKNTTLWFSLLNETEQREIVARLEASPRAGIIVQNSLVELMQANRIPMKGVLWDYLHQHFVVAFKLEGFAFWTKAGRTITPLNVASRRQLKSEVNPTTLPASVLDFSLIADGTPIREIYLNQGGTVMRLGEKNLHVTATGVTREGHPVTLPEGKNWPLEVKGLVHLTISLDPKDFSAIAPGTYLILRGGQGENLGEIGIAE